MQKIITFTKVIKGHEHCIAVNYTQIASFEVWLNPKVSVCVRFTMLNGEKINWEKKGQFEEDITRELHRVLTQHVEEKSNLILRLDELSIFEPPKTGKYAQYRELSTKDLDRSNFI